MPPLWSRTIASVTKRSVRSARLDFESFIAGYGEGRYDIGAAVMIFGEMIANACLHGRPPVHIELYRSADGVLLRMVDGGTGIVRPRGIRAEDSLSGRGFEIMEKLGGHLTIAAPPRSEVTVALPYAT